ncbi:TetR/AcrR family transcriptional regulator [Cognatilysobacter tabacisoli]|uniref:TetR/AcrR family transcriptional regulator n=1 Tax=Cognatilysobacter tabacisoli TaxID=2315424 RepID=UPI000E6B11CA|nr:TetR/AcrR family transcriptional regulator [Lysobacter tabacisoli]
MSPATFPAPLGKGAATRDVIIERAYGIACSAGLEGLSIGPLAQAVGMSKSGVFAHFGSREDLQLAVLDAAGARFLEAVLVPSLKARRGLPRLRAIVDAWFDWVRDNDGGCLLIAAAAEYDDRPGPLRDRVVQHETRWRSDVARAIGLAIDSGELRADTDAAQFAFEIYAVAIAVNHDAGLYGLETAVARGRRLFERLLASYSPTA